MKKKIVLFLLVLTFSIHLPAQNTITTDRVVSNNDTVFNEVVETGMQRIDKKLFAGATTKINFSEAKLDGVADISRSLEGRAAGVSVQNVSGTFGSAPKIMIRGATSIYGNSRPLWVIDGVVQEDAIYLSSDDLSSGNAETLISSAVAGLNADDIESIRILKDGSATAIYGARAMAGVVVVTTKKGQTGVRRISYTGEFTHRLKPSCNDFNIINSQDQMKIFKEMEAKGWLEFANVASSANSGIYGKMYDLISTYNQETHQWGLPNTQEAKNDFLQRYENINTDWFDLLFNSNVMQNHALSFSYGTKKVKHYISLSAMNDPGWTKSSWVERYTLNINGSYDLCNKLTLNIHGSGSYRNQKAPGTSDSYTNNSGEIKRNFDINPYRYSLNTSRTLDPNEYYRMNYAPFNILYELNNNYIDLNVVNFSFQGDLTWKIKKGWEAMVLGAIKYQKSKQEHNVRDHSNQAMAYRAGVDPDNPTIRALNPYLYTDPDDPYAFPISILPVGGIYTYTGNTVKSLDFRGQTNYSTNINDIHIINFFGAAEISSIKRAGDCFQKWGYIYENEGITTYEYKEFKQIEQDLSYDIKARTEYRSVAFIANATYSYKGKYVVNGTARYEGVNNIGQSYNSKWLPTWSGGLAWNIHEENWFKNPVLSHGTIRSSYSLTAGRVPDDVINAMPVFTPETRWVPFANGAEYGITLTETANRNLTYEKKHELNIGVDLGFLNNRINVVSDYYIRNNYDLIGYIYTTGESGGGILQRANVASMRSGGFELTVSAQNIVTKNFKWNTDFIFAKATNKITDLKNRPTVMDLVSGNGFVREGYPIRALFSVPFVGISDEGLPTFINERGEVTVSNINFQNYSDLDFLKYEGPTDPTILGSLGNNFNYKGFTLNVYLTYSFGNVVRLDPAFSVSYSDISSMPKEFMKRWTIPGDEKTTNIPVIASRRQLYNNGYLAYGYTAYNYCDLRVAKGDFIKMKDISLSYNFPKKWLEPIYLNTASLKLQVTNLFLIYADKKLKGQDPEFYNSGGVAAPMPKQITLSVRFSL